MILLLRYIEDKYIPQNIRHYLLKFLQEYVSCTALLDFNFLICLRTVFLSTCEK